MSDYRYLVRRNSLPDISYETDQPVETIYPRVIHRTDGPYVYCKKVHVRLDHFLTRLANGEDGLWVAGYRRNGRQTTISFSKRDRVKISEQLQKILDEISGIRKPARAVPANGSKPPEVSAKRKGKPSGKMTLSDLEERLAKQREIGKVGEDAAYRHEYQRLFELGCLSPGDCIEIVSEEDVGAGFDLKSYWAGETRYIEVKASTVRDTSFFVSENERVRLEELGDGAFIYLVRVRLDDPKKSVVTQELRNPFGSGKNIELKPIAWMAELPDGESDWEV